MGSFNRRTSLKRCTLAFSNSSVTFPLSSRRLSTCNVSMLNRNTAASASLVKLSTGISMEVLPRLAPIALGNAGHAPNSNSPLLLIHGSFHAAWCWNYFQEYFANLGISSFAISLRGAGKTVIDPAEKCLARGKYTLGETLEDLEDLLCKLNIPPPVVVGHSTGGLIAQHWAQNSSPGTLAGLVLLASKPPFGQNALAWRTTRKIGLIGLWRLTMGFARKAVATDLDLCREVFFSKHGSKFDEELEGDHRLLEYMRYFGEQYLPIDLNSLHKKPVLHPGSLSGKTLVIGGEVDHIVDVESIRDTAKLFGVEGEDILIPSAPHDLMLCSAWRVVASKMMDWLVAEGYAVQRA